MIVGEEAAVVPTGLVAVARDTASAVADRAGRFGELQPGAARLAAQPASTSRRGIPATRAQSRSPTAIVAAVFLSTYLSWRPFEIMLTISDALFLAGAGYLLLNSRLSVQPFGRLTAGWLAAFLVMILGFLIGTIANGDPFRWLVTSSQYAFAWVLLPMLLIGHGRENTVTLIKAFLAGLFCLELFGALTYYEQTTALIRALPFLGEDVITGNRRLSGFLLNPNWNAAAISMALPFVFYCAAQRLLSGVLVFPIIVVLFLGLVLSASATGIITAIVAVAIFHVVGAVRPSVRGMVLMAGIAVLVGKLGYEPPEPFQHRVGGAIQSGKISEAGTYESRVALNEEAWSIVEDRMIVGLGIDQYREVSAYDQAVHNMYLLVWAEGGLLSLLGWIGMIAVLAVRAAKTYSRNRLAAALPLSVLSSLLIFASATPHMYARMWAVPILLALAVAYDEVASTSRQRREPLGARSGRPYL